MLTNWGERFYPSVAARKVDAEDCLADDLVDQRRNRRMEAPTPPNFLVWQMPR